MGFGPSTMLLMLQYTFGKRLQMLLFTIFSKTSAHRCGTRFRIEIRHNQRSAAASAVNDLRLFVAAKLAMRNHCSSSIMPRATWTDRNIENRNAGASQNINERKISDT
jgi:hypothetical protein